MGSNVYSADRMTFQMVNNIGIDFAQLTVPDDPDSPTNVIGFQSFAFPIIVFLDTFRDEFWNEGYELISAHDKSKR